MSPLPVSVIVCTLNEQENIAACIEHVLLNDPAEILLVDGESSDDTVSIAEQLGMRVVRTTRGLAHQRQVGVDASAQPFIAFVDADDRLHPQCLITLMNEARLNGYLAVKAQTRSYAARTYWEQAMDLNLRLFMNKPGVTNMVGRPALYARQVFDHLRFNVAYDFGDEDTDFSRQMERAGMKQGIGTGISYRKHLKTMRACMRQWFRYGSADAKFVYIHPDRTTRMLWHLLVNYPIIKPATLVWRGQAYYSFFFILQGAVRFFGLVVALVHLAIARPGRRGTG